jgi:hypothetical protein
VPYVIILPSTVSCDMVGRDSKLYLNNSLHINKHIRFFRLKLKAFSFFALITSFINLVFNYLVITKLKT